MKRVSLDPINRNATINTNDSLLDALLSEQLDVLMLCGGRGRCATCLVHVEDGMESLTAMTPRERKTLGRISSATPQSRLACQACVRDEGVKVRLPEGMYIEQVEDLMNYLGKRAEMDILHPIDGRVLIPKGKIILRSSIRELQSLNIEVQQVRVIDT